MEGIVVDTNVARVANGDAPQADTECRLACVTALRAIQAGSMPVLLDDSGLILGEYLRQRPFGVPRAVGDAFVVWINDNQANPAVVQQVAITPLAHDPRGFAEFPADPGLATFHSDDRKFVAVALASEPTPEILNAIDSDWAEHHSALRLAGVRVKFLCPQHVSPRD